MERPTEKQPVVEEGTAGRELRDEDQVLFLCKLLGHRDPEGRFQAARDLGKADPLPNEAVIALAQALGDGKICVAAEADFALGKLGARAAAAVPVLIEALGSPRTYHPVAVAHVLGSIGAGARRAVPTLC